MWIGSIVSKLEFISWISKDWEEVINKVKSLGYDFNISEVNNYSIEFTPGRFIYLQKVDGYSLNQLKLLPIKKLFLDYIDCLLLVSEYCNVPIESIITSKIREITKVLEAKALFINLYFKYNYKKLTNAALAVIVGKKLEAVRYYKRLATNNFSIEKDLKELQELIFNKFNLKPLR